ncbi:MAG: hypothetical protein QXX95_06705 [Nitrososphaerales archaeon]
MSFEEDVRKKFEELRKSLNQEYERVLKESESKLVSIKEKAKGELEKIR